MFVEITKITDYVFVENLDDTMLYILRSKNGEYHCSYEQHSMHHKLPFYVQMQEDELFQEMLVYDFETLPFAAMILIQSKMKYVLDNDDIVGCTVYEIEGNTINELF